MITFKDICDIVGRTPEEVMEIIKGEYTISIIGPKPKEKACHPKNHELENIYGKKKCDKCENYYKEEMKGVGDGDS